MERILFAWIDASRHDLLAQLDRWAGEPFGPPPRTLSLPNVIDTVIVGALVEGSDGFYRWPGFSPFNSGTGEGASMPDEEGWPFNPTVTLARPPPGKARMRLMVLVAASGSRVVLRCAFCMPRAFRPSTGYRAAASTAPDTEDTKWSDSVVQPNSASITVRLAS